VTVLMAVVVPFAYSLEYVLEHVDE
jgi:hypothetical protein